MLLALSEVVRKAKRRDRLCPLSEHGPALDRGELILFRTAEAGATWRDLHRYRVPAETTKSPAVLRESELEMSPEGWRDACPQHRHRGAESTAQSSTGIRVGSSTVWQVSVME